MRYSRSTEGGIQARELHAARIVKFLEQLRKHVPVWQAVALYEDGVVANPVRFMYQNKQIYIRPSHQVCTWKILTVTAYHVPALRPRTENPAKDQAQCLKRRIAESHAYGSDIRRMSWSVRQMLPQH